MNILPLTYLGNVQYFSKLCFSDCTIDLHEHYRKQSYLTRCNILMSDGVATLTVPVVKTSNFDKARVMDVKIDYTKRWQHQHWQSLVSAYRNSPYFDYYEQEFEPLYAERGHELLMDWNIALLKTILRLLGCPETVPFSNHYIEPTLVDIDYRTSISSKPRLWTPDPLFSQAEYHQVFAETVPFAPNLSVVDLLFCEGTSALKIIENSLQGSKINY